MCNCCASFAYIEYLWLVSPEFSCYIPYELISCYLQFDNICFDILHILVNNYYNNASRVSSMLR